MWPKAALCAFDGTLVIQINFIICLQSFIVFVNECLIGTCRTVHQQIVCLQTLTPAMFVFQDSKTLFNGDSLPANVAHTILLLVPDVVLEETISVFRKMPNLVDFEQLITLLQCFLQLEGDPCSMHSSISIGMLAGFLSRGVSTGTA